MAEYADRDREQERRFGRELWQPLLWIVLGLLFLVGLVWGVGAWVMAGWQARKASTGGSDLMPPAMRIECSDNCRNPMKYCPKNSRNTRTMKASTSSRSNTRVRLSGATSSSTDRKTGMLPSGSITRNKRVAAEMISMVVSPAFRLSVFENPRSMIAK